jgi:predicted RNase H-like HicB family nuclease
MNNYHTFKIIIRSDEPQGFHALVPALPGCHSFGTTIFEAKKNILEAIELYLESQVGNKNFLPESDSEELIEYISIPKQSIHV